MSGKAWAIAVLLASASGMIAETASAQTPPATPPPPPSAPPPPLPPPAAAVDRHHAGFLLLPYVGVHKFFGETTENTGPGFRMSVIIGGRLAPWLSLNGELTGDVVNFDQMPVGVAVEESVVDVAFSPLAHFQAGPAEVAIGPKLGVMTAEATSQTFFSSSTAEATGWVGGINAGAFGPVSSTVSLGAVFSMSLRKTTEVCSNDTGTRMCTSNGLPSAITAISLGVATLY